MGNGEQGNRWRQEERIRARKEVEPKLVQKGRAKGRSRRLAVEILPLPQKQLQPPEQRWKPPKEHEPPYWVESAPEPVTQ